MMDLINYEDAIEFMDFSELKSTYWKEVFRD